jgi:inosine-uridine nucleoside N-ribohydrolase
VVQEEPKLTSSQGVDDVLALLLAFSAHPDELEVLLVSVTYGNVEVQKLVSLVDAHT